MNSKLLTAFGAGLIVLSSPQYLWAETHNYKADNTAQNVVDKDMDTVLPESQSNNPAFIERSAVIRREIGSNENLSVNAHNIKIVTLENGDVILRGPVMSKEEKIAIERIADRQKGNAKVKSFLTVKTN